MVMNRVNHQQSVNKLQQRARDFTSSKNIAPLCRHARLRALERGHRDTRLSSNAR